MRAIILIIALALRTLEASPDLGTDTHTVADFDRLDFRADFDGVAYDFMAHSNWEWAFTPPAIYGVDV